MGSEQLNDLKPFLEEHKVPSHIIAILIDQGYNLESFSKLTMGYFYLLQLKLAEIQQLMPLLEIAHDTFYQDPPVRVSEQVNYSRTVDGNFQDQSKNDINDGYDTDESSDSSSLFSYDTDKPGVKRRKLDNFEPHSPILDFGNNSSPGHFNSSSPERSSERSPRPDRSAAIRSLQSLHSRIRSEPEGENASLTNKNPISPESSLGIQSESEQNASQTNSNPTAPQSSRIQSHSATATSASSSLRVSHQGSTQFPGSCQKSLRPPLRTLLKPTENSQNTAQSSSSSGQAGTSNGPSAHFEHIKPELPKFHVSAILKERMEPKDETWVVYLRLQKEGFLEKPSERKMVMRLLIRYLYSLHAKKPTEVTTIEKEGMAKSFILEYPKYCGEHNQENLPWDHIYCKKKNTGWFVNASRALQKNNPSRERKKQTSEDETDDPDAELNSDEIDDMATQVPGTSERHDISEGMRRSFKRREALRASGTDITSFLKTFPHLMSYNGEMLKQEFKRMRPTSKDLCRAFLPFLPKVLQLNLKYPINLSHEDDTIKALMMLSQHLPHDISKRQDGSRATSTCPAESTLINYISSNELVEDYIEQKRADSPGGQPVQPYLLAIVSSITKKVQKYFVVADDSMTQLPPICQPIKAIEYLIATYFVFHVDYPFGWRNTLHFLASCFLEAFETRTVGHRADGVTPSEKGLWLLLKNM